MYSLHYTKKYWGVRLMEFKLARLELHLLIIIVVMLIYGIFRINSIFNHKYNNKKHYILIVATCAGLISILFLNNISIILKTIIVVVFYIISTIYIYINTFGEKLIYLAYIFIIVLSINILLTTIILSFIYVNNSPSGFVYNHCRGIQYICFVLIYVFLDIKLSKFWTNGYFFDTFAKKKKNILTNILIVITILFTIICLIYEELYILGQSAVFLSYPVIIFFILSMFLLIFKINLESLEYITFKKNKEVELDSMEKSIEMINNIDNSKRILYHDLNNHISMLKYYLDDGNIVDAKKYIEKLGSQIKNIDSEKICNNNIVNGILILKNDKCIKNDIQTTFNIQISKKLGIENQDLVQLLSNVLDNAIESNLKVANIEKRFITILMKEENTSLTIKVQNSTNNKGDISILKTSKEDKYQHGFGVQSMKKVIDKYEGIMELKNSDYIFTAKFYIPLYRGETND